MTKLKFTYQGRGKERLDSWLSHQVPDKSRSQLQALIKQGRVFVNERLVFQPSQSLQSGDIVAVDFPPPPKLEPDEDIQFSVIADEPTFIIVNKPAGLVVHPGSGNWDRTLVNGLIARYPEITKVGEDPLRPGIVHRLDKETSGVMVIARSQEEYENLQRQFRERETEKIYFAVLAGELEKDSGVIKGMMRRSVAVPVKRELVATGDGKESQTNYQVLGRQGGQTLVKARPKTGRTHQLRVHFASLGHPIVGDTLYGPRKQSETLQLHARNLRFRDSRGIWREYEAPFPEGFNWPDVDKISG
jgi:23S rRNA pseudouridine1911/1915/1917 synthase